MRYIFILLVSLSSIYTSQAQRNVILIIADDFGSDWCGFQENYVDTVNLTNVRRLLSRGVRFKNAWSNPVCSPTRAGIITGRYSFRTGVGNVVMGTTSTPLDVTETSLPALLKSSKAPTKYVSANIGKWHLQSSSTANYNNPSKMGYNYAAGVFTGAPMPSYTSWSKVTNGVVSTSTNYLTVETTSDAINWIGQQANKPYFLWLAYNAPHTPFHLPPDSLHSYTLSGTTSDINQNPKNYYKAMSEAMDREIGRLFNYLQATGQWDNTDIIFIGDNGDPQRVSQNNNADRAKGTVYQVGVHVPFIISGPSVVNPGRVSDALVNVQDLFATILELGGFTNWAGEISTSKPVDSKSLLPIIKDQAQDVRNWAYTEIFDPNPTATINARAIRNKEYKLIYQDSSKKQEFYKIRTDTDELTNLLTGSMSNTDVINYTTLCDTMSALLSKSICDKTVNAYDITKSKPTIAPNPAKDYLYVSFDTNESFHYQLINNEGKVVKLGDSQREIPIKDLPKGVYFVRLVTSKTNSIHKILLEK